MASSQKYEADFPFIEGLRWITTFVRIGGNSTAPFAKSGKSADTATFGIVACAATPVQAALFKNPLLFIMSRFLSFNGW